MTQYKKLWLHLVVSIALALPLSAQASLHFWALFRQQPNWQFMHIGYVVLRILDMQQTGTGPAAILYFIPDNSLPAHNGYPELVPSDSTETHLKNNTAGTHPGTTTPSPSGSTASSYKSQGRSPASGQSGSLKPGSYDKHFTKKKKDKDGCREAGYIPITQWGGEPHQMAITFVNNDRKPKAVPREEATQVRLKIKKGTSSNYIPHDENAFFMAIIDIVTYAISAQASVQGMVTLSGMVRTKVRGWHTRSGDFPNPDPMFGVFCQIRVTATQIGESPQVGFVFTPPGMNDPLTIMHPVPITEINPDLLWQTDDFIELSNEHAQQMAAGHPPSPEQHDPEQFDIEVDNSPPSNSPTEDTGLLDQATGTSPNPTAHVYDVVTELPEGLPLNQVQQIANTPGHPLQLQALRRLRPPLQSFPAGSTGNHQVPPGYVQHHPFTPASQPPPHQPSQAEERRRRRQANYEMVPTPQTISEFSRLEIQEFAHNPLHERHREATEHLKRLALSPPSSDPLYTPHQEEITGLIGNLNSLTNAQLRWLVETRGNFAAQRILKNREGEFVVMEDDELWAIINNPHSEEWRKQSAREELRKRRRTRPLVYSRNAYEEHHFRKDDDQHGPDGGAGLSGLSPSNSGGGGAITFHPSSSKHSTNSGSSSYSGNSGYKHQHASNYNYSQYEDPRKAEIFEQLSDIVLPVHLLPAFSQSTD